MPIRYSGLRSDDVLDAVDWSRRKCFLPGGKRKDKMSYYDHLRSLRGPEQPLVSIYGLPKRRLDPCTRGGQQRGTPS